MKAGKRIRKAVDVKQEIYRNRIRLSEKKRKALFRQLHVDPGVFLTKTSTIGFGNSHVYGLSHDHVLHEHVLLGVAKTASFLDLTNGSGGIRLR
jgi:hypothetical protein